MATSPPPSSSSSSSVTSPRTYNGPTASPPCWVYWQHHLREPWGINPDLEMHDSTIGLAFSQRRTSLSLPIDQHLLSPLTRYSFCYRPLSPHVAMNTNADRLANGLPCLRRFAHLNSHPFEAVKTHVDHLGRAVPLSLAKCAPSSFRVSIVSALRLASSPCATSHTTSHFLPTCLTLTLGSAHRASSGAKKTSAVIRMVPQASRHATPSDIGYSSDSTRPAPHVSFSTLEAQFPHQTQYKRKSKAHNGFIAHTSPPPSPSF
ncbi:hypothetical protein EDB86DRAFT_3245726 [Lactarius hatsudake]|nr:hypothetical protein EDB86DRAFT_3245726 [Lactarius hatsudake]